MIDDLIAAARRFFLAPLGAQTESAAAGLVGFEDRLARLDDDAAGREIRARHHLDKFFNAGVRVLDQMQQRRAELIDVVRRDVGRHADRDARRAVGEQIGKRRRQHDGFEHAAIVVRAEIDGVFVEPFEDGGRDVGHARFGVARGGRIIAVDVAEVALAIDQRIAHGEILREARERIVDRLVAVRMQIAHHVADDLGALQVSARRIEFAVRAWRRGCGGERASSRRARRAARDA